MMIPLQFESRCRIVVCKTGVHNKIRNLSNTLAPVKKGRSPSAESSTLRPGTPGRFLKNMMRAAKNGQ
jgi:hypothetical protein